MYKRYLLIEYEHTDIFRQNNVQIVDLETKHIWEHVDIFLISFHLKRSPFLLKVCFVYILIPFNIEWNKQRNYRFHFRNIMMWSLSGDWTRDLLHLKPALYHWGCRGGRENSSTGIHHKKGQAKTCQCSKRQGPDVIIENLLKLDNYIVTYINEVKLLSYLRQIKAYSLAISWLHW